MQGTNLRSNDPRVAGKKVVGGGIEEQFQRRLVSIGSGEVNRVKAAVIPERSISTTLRRKQESALVET